MSFFSGHGLMNNSNTNYLTQATIQFNSNESFFRDETYKCRKTIWK